MNGQRENKEQLNGSQMELIKTLHSTGIRAKTMIKAFAELEKQRDAGGGDEREEEEEKQGTAQQQVGAVHQVGQQKGPHDTAAFLLLHQLATVARHDHCELFEPRSQMFSFTSADEAERKGRRQTNAKGTEARTSPTPWQEQNGTQPTSSCPGPAHAVAPSSSGRPIRSQRTPMKEIITLDDPTELDEFMARGEEQCIHAMRAFITQFSLRQTTVATMTGVSQPYISKLLNGNHRELSLRCRKNIYCWYLNCRRHPEKLAMFVQDPCTRLETSADGELVPQRRERYVFRPVLLRVLEAFFQECAFPDIAKRVEIANVCNAHLQMDKRGAQLLPKEVVTPQVIANWFANKRKEMRRRMGGTGAELGRSRLNSSSAGHSNSPWSPNSATLAQQERRVESRSEQSSNSDEATTAQWEQQAMPLPLLANANQQQTRLISDQHECAMSAVDLALLLPQLGPSAQPDHCPTAPPLLSQSVLQFAPSVDQLIHLLQAQPVANQLMLLQQLLVGTSSTDNDYLKQDQQHMLMAIHDQ